MVRETDNRMARRQGGVFWRLYPARESSRRQHVENSPATSRRTDRGVLDRDESSSSDIRNVRARDDSDDTAHFATVTDGHDAYLEHWSDEDCIRSLERACRPVLIDSDALAT